MSRGFSTLLQSLDGESVWECISYSERGRAVQPLVELDRIESDDLVAKGKLVLCMKSVEQIQAVKIRARLVAMGNGLFDKHMSIRRAAALHDLSSPVASTAEARAVLARARETESIDLIAASPQVILGGGVKHHMIILERLRRALPHEEKARVSAEELPSVSPDQVEISS